MEPLLGFRCAAFRGTRKGRIARAEEPNGARRPGGKLSLNKSDSTAALRRVPAQRINQFRKYIHYHLTIPKAKIAKR